MLNILYRINPPITNIELNTLFSAAWTDHQPSDFHPVLNHSLAYIGAYDAGRLVGFINLAWDGGIHAFLLDTTVHLDAQRQGIGSELVRRAVDVARERGIEWLHVDFEPHLLGFYRACGFRQTEAGLMRLKGSSE
jgi:GNAT superfamily N-acetyltransferase